MSKAAYREFNVVVQQPSGNYTLYHDTCIINIERTESGVIVQGKSNTIVGLAQDITMRLAALALSAVDIQARLVRAGFHDNNNIGSTAGWFSSDPNDAVDSNE